MHDERACSLCERACRPGDHSRSKDLAARCVRAGFRPRIPTAPVAAQGDDGSTPPTNQPVACGQNQPTGRCKPGSVWPIESDKRTSGPTL